MKNFIKLFSFLFLIIILFSQNAFTEEKKKLLNPGWSFKISIDKVGLRDKGL